MYSLDGREAATKVEVAGRRCSGGSWHRISVAVQENFSWRSNTLYRSVGQNICLSAVAP